MNNTSPTLPRDTRDTFLVLTVVTLVVLPQLASLPLWASALALTLLAWRFWLARTYTSLPNKWLMAALLVLVVAATVLQFRSIVGPEAGVVLIVLLLVLKTLEMRARRDAMVIFFWVSSHCSRYFCNRNHCSWPQLCCLLCGGC